MDFYLNLSVIWSLHDFGIPTGDTLPLQSNRTSVWCPNELGNLVRPKLSRVIVRISLSVIMPSMQLNTLKYRNKNFTSITTIGVFSF